MAVTTVQLKQTITALVGGVGIRSSHAIGGTNIISDDVDIAFGFTMKCGHANNIVDLTYNDSGASNKPTLEINSGGVATNLICDQEIAANSIIQDAAFADTATIAKIVAIYFEAPASNTGGVTITGDSAAVGTVSFTALGGSVLLFPRFTPVANTTKHVMALTTVGNILKVVVLGNTS